MNDQSKIKAVRIMADWGANGVWSARCVPESTMDGFRVSRALWRRIQRWQRWYEAHDPALDVDGDRTFKLEAFTREGLEIARAVKLELPDWIVIYVDEMLLAEAGKRNWRWMDHHYEVGLRPH